MKKNHSNIPAEELATFVTKLQAFGIPVDAYVGAYNTQQTNHAMEDEQKFDAPD